MSVKPFGTDSFATSIDHWLKRKVIDRFKGAETNATESLSQAAQVVNQMLQAMKTAFASETHTAQPVKISPQTIAAFRSDIHEGLAQTGKNGLRNISGL